MGDRIFRGTEYYATGLCVCTMCVLCMLMCVLFFVVCVLCWWLCSVKWIVSSCILSCSFKSVTAISSYYPTLLSFHRKCLVISPLFLLLSLVNGSVRCVCECVSLCMCVYCMYFLVHMSLLCCVFVVCVCVCVCMCVCVCVCVYVCVCVCVCDCEYVCVWVCSCVCLCFTHCWTLFNAQFWLIFFTAVYALQCPYLTRVVLALGLLLFHYKYVCRVPTLFLLCYSTVVLYHHSGTTKDLCQVQEGVQLEKFTIV